MTNIIQKWTLPAILGGGATYVYFPLLAQEQPDEHLLLIFIFLYLLFIFTTTAYFLVFRFLRARYVAVNTPLKVILPITFFFLGLLATANLPIRYPTKSVPVDLAVSATGFKNPKSLGSEVWLTKALQSGYYEIPVEVLNFDAGWEVKDGIPVSYRTQPAVLSWSGRTNSDVKLVFISHQWSGEVEVTVNGETKIVDLYSLDTTVKTVEMPVSGLEVSGVGNFLFFNLVSFYVGLLLLSFSIWIAGYKGRLAKPIKSGGWGWIYFAMPFLLVWSIYQLTYWPAIMSNDSVDQWSQVLSGRFVDSHPAFHTLIIWVITRVWMDPASVAIFQLICMAFLVAYILYRFARIGVSIKALGGASLLIVVNPLNGIFIVTLWKDIFYSFFVLLLIVFIFEIYISEGEWASQRRNMVLIGMCAAICALLRHNGLAAGFGSLVMLIPIYRKQWKYLGFALIIGVSTWLIIRYPIYNLLGVQRVESTESVAVPFAHHVAAHLTADTYLYEQEIDYLSTIRPIDDDWSYNCYNVIPTFFSPLFDSSHLKVNSNSIQRLTLDLFLRNPFVNLDHMACASSVIWRFQTPINTGMTIYSVYRGDEEEIRTIAEIGGDYGLIPDSKAPGLIEPVMQFAEWIRTNTITRLVFTKPSFHLFVITLLCLIKMIRDKNWKVVTLLFPVLFHSALLFLLIVSQSVRYQYSIILFSMVFWPYFFSSISNSPLKENLEGEIL